MHTAKRAAYRSFFRAQGPLQRGAAAEVSQPDSAQAPSGIDPAVRTALEVRIRELERARPLILLTAETVSAGEILKCRPVAAQVAEQLLGRSAQLARHLPGLGTGYKRVAAPVRFGVATTLLGADCDRPW